MLDHTDQDTSQGETLGDDAEYASLTRRAATDNSRALVNDVLRLITEAEPRKRKRGRRADTFRQANEGFVGDLLAATGGWVYRPVGRSHFTDDVVSYRNFTATMSRWQQTPCRSCIRPPQGLRPASSHGDG